MSSRLASSTPGTERRYVGAAPSPVKRPISRGIKIAIVLGLLAAVLIAVIPPAVVVHRNKENRVEAAQDRAIGFTTVVNGITTFIQTKTQDVVTRTSLSTLENGEISTITSAITIPVITVSLTSLNAIQTGFVTTTLGGEVVVLATQTNTIQGGGEAQIVTRTISGGPLSVATIVQTFYDDTTIIVEPTRT